MPASSPSNRASGLITITTTSTASPRRAGALQNLRIGGEERDALRSNVGTRLHAIFDFGSDQSLMPEFSIAWAHNLIDPAVTLDKPPRFHLMEIDTMTRHAGNLGGEP